MAGFWTIITVILAEALLASWINKRRFPRLSPGHENPDARLSILIAARRGEGYIGRMIRQAEALKPLEVIVLVPNMHDSTLERARSANPSVRIIESEPIPKGWTWMQWARHQLARHANGNVLLFTEPQVSCNAGGFAGLAGLTDRESIALVWPTPEVYTFSDRLLATIISVARYAFIPGILLKLPWLGNRLVDRGACLLVGRETFLESAEAPFRSARSVTIADGAGIVTSPVGEFEGRLLLLWPAALIYWMLFVFPLLWLVGGLFLDLGPGWPWWPLALVLAGVAVGALSSVLTTSRARPGFLLPLAVLHFTARLLAVTRQRVFGGRRVINPEPEHATRTVEASPAG